MSTTLAAAPAKTAAGWQEVKGSISGAIGLTETQLTTSARLLSCFGETVSRNALPNSLGLGAAGCR
jgi:hypothetical protein